MLARVAALVYPRYGQFAGVPADHLEIGFRCVVVGADFVYLFLVFSYVHY